MAQGPLTHSSNSLLVSLFVGSGAPEIENEWLLEWACQNICYLQKKRKKVFYLCQTVKASKELVESSNQNLGRQVHGQKSEALDVCEKDALGRSDRKRATYLNCV